MSNIEYAPTMRAHEGAEKVGGAVKKAGGKAVEETKEAAKKVKDKID